MEKKLSNEKEIFDELEISNGEELKEKENLIKLINLKSNITETAFKELVETYGLSERLLNTIADSVKDMHRDSLNSNDLSQGKTLDIFGYVTKQFADAINNPDISEDERNRCAEQAIEMVKMVDKKDTENKEFIRKRDNFGGTILAIGSAVSIVGLIAYAVVKLKK